MSRLSEEFGLSDRGLAKICERHKVPTPPRGYWAKLAAGKPVQQEPLPDLPDQSLQEIDIEPSPETSPADQKADVQAREIEAEIGTIGIPESLQGLHPIVAKWVEEHRQDQAKRRQERRANRDRWFQPELRADLAERDKYRFRVTSAFLKALEKRDGVAVSGDLRGRLKLRVCGEEFECSIVEKMKRKLKAAPEDEGWTAWPEHHNSGLYPSGFLRFTINTWSISEKDLVESKEAKADTLLPRFVSRVLAAGPILVQQRQEAAEREAQWRRKAAERAERERLAQLDAKRWEQFRQCAKDWEECTRLRAFIEALRKQSSEMEVEVDGCAIEEWIAWAEARLEAMDPLASSKTKIFALPRHTNAYPAW